MRLLGFAAALAVVGSSTLAQAQVRSSALEPPAPPLVSAAPAPRALPPLPRIDSVDEWIARHRERDIALRPVRARRRRTFVMAAVGIPFTLGGGAAAALGLEAAVSGRRPSGGHSAGRIGP